MSYNLVGRDADQIPVNGFLGTLAFQDHKAVVIKGGTIDNVVGNFTTLTGSSTLNLTGSGSTTTSLGTAATTGTTQIGGTTQTGTITLGQSTATHTLNIDAGATISGATKTIGFGTIGVAGSTTNINIGSAVQGALGKTIANQGMQLGSNGTPIYQTKLDFGSDAAGTWRKLFTVSIGTGMFQTAAYKIDIVDPNANHAIVGSINADKYTYYVACIRTEYTIQDTPDACYISGPASHIRAVRLSTGNYEIQVANEQQWQEYLITIQLYTDSNGLTSATYYDGSALASVGANTYTAAVGTATDWFQQVRVLGNGNADALRITQIGIGNALVVEDSANPDSSPFVIKADGNVGIGTTSPTAKLDVAGSVNISQDLSVSGNVYISGNTTVLSSNNLVLNDSIIYLANNNPANLNDIGFVGNFTSGSYQHTGFVRDATDGVWKLFSNVVSEPTNTVDFTDAIYDSIRVGNVYGTVYGNANTATALATGRTIAISGAATGTATSFDGSQNITIPVTSLNSASLTGTISNSLLNVGTTSSSGIVQLTDSVSSTSTTTASTANSVKTAYDLASTKYSSSGGTINGNVNIAGTWGLLLIPWLRI